MRDFAFSIRVHCVPHSMMAEECVESVTGIAEKRTSFEADELTTAMSTEQDTSANNVHTPAFPTDVASETEQKSDGLISTASEGSATPSASSLDEKCLPSDKSAERQDPLIDEQPSVKRVDSCACRSCTNANALTKPKCDKLVKAVHNISISIDGHIFTVDFGQQGRQIYKPATSHPSRQVYVATTSSIRRRTHRLPQSVKLLSRNISLDRADSLHKSGGVTRNGDGHLDPKRIPHPPFLVARDCACTCCGHYRTQSLTLKQASSRGLLSVVPYIPPSPQRTELTTCAAITPLIPPPLSTHSSDRQKTLAFARPLLDGPLKLRLPLKCPSPFALFLAQRQQCLSRPSPQKPALVGAIHWQNCEKTAARNVKLNEASPCDSGFCAETKLGMDGRTVGFRRRWCGRTWRHRPTVDDSSYGHMNVSLPIPAVDQLTIARHLAAMKELRKRL